MSIVSVAFLVFAAVTYLSYRIMDPARRGEAAEPRVAPSRARRNPELRSLVNWFMQSPVRQIYVILPMCILNFMVTRVLTRSPLLALIWTLIIGTMCYFGLSQGLHVYRNRLNRQLLDLINVLAGSINAGLSLQQSFQAIAENDTLPLFKEFARAVHHWQLGASMETVLESLNRRIQSSDLQLLSSVLLLNQELGGDLSGMLERTAIALRERDRLRRELRRSTAQARLTAIIGVVLPCALATLIHIMNPAYLRPMYRTTLGLLFIGCGVLLMSVGILVIHRMSRSIGN